MSKAVFPGRGIRVAIVFLGAYVAGCGDSTSATPALGTHYELTSFGDRPLPYTWRGIVSADGVFACDDEITAGRLLFGAAHSVTEILDRALKCNDGSPPALSADTAAGQYMQSGTQLTLELQGALTTEGRSPYTISATIRGDEIRVEKTVSRTSIGTLTDLGARVFTLTR